jgi:hypothetical protein
MSFAEIIRAANNRQTDPRVAAEGNAQREAHAPAVESLDVKPVKPVSGRGEPPKTAAPKRRS